MSDRRFAPTLRAAHMRAALLAFVATACSPDRILEVEDIDVAQPPAVQGPTALPSLLAGAIGDFGTAFNGNMQSTGLALDLNQVTLSGSISDEFINTETFPTRIEVDQRQQQYQSNGSLRDAYYAIQQARASADRASEAFVEFGPTDIGLAEALNLGALSLILMAENYCGAIPISKETSPGVFEYGSALDTDEILERALAKADSALAHARAASTTGAAATKTAQERLARIVRARALLNLDRPAEAGTALGEAEVPTTYQYFFKHSEVTGRQNNGTWLTTASVARFGVRGSGGDERVAVPVGGRRSQRIQRPACRQRASHGRGRRLRRGHAAVDSDEARQARFTRHHRRWRGSAPDPGGSSIARQGITRRR